MRFGFLVVALFLLPEFGFALSNSPGFEPLLEEPVIIERHLSDGTPVTITIHPTGETAEALNITILAGGTEISIPAECLTDLPDCNVPDGVQVADFAGDLFLLLAGGEGGSSWQAKITLRGNRVVRRELYRNGKQLPEVLSVQSDQAPPSATSISTLGSTTLEFPDAKPIFKGEKAP